MTAVYAGADEHIMPFLTLRHKDTLFQSLKCSASLLLQLLYTVLTASVCVNIQARPAYIKFDGKLLIY